jgi:methionyl-tRNA formyltransferase
MSYFAITSNHPRHVKFLETLYDKVELSTVVVIDKGPIKQGEVDYFNSDMSLLENSNVIRCTKQQLCSDFILQSLHKLAPKVGFIFGAPLLKKELFEIPQYGCVNIHTGLVNHYRGVDSSLWAMYDNRPDLIGATLHYIDKSIDAGNVIDTGVISIDQLDSLESLFYKTCQTGFYLLSSNIDDIIANKANKRTLKNRGKLYQNKDKNSDIVNRAKENLRKYKNENYFRSL